MDDASPVHLPARCAGGDGDVLPATGRVHFRRLPPPALHWQCPHSVPGSREGGRSVEERKRHEETIQPGRRALLPRWPAAVALLTVGALYAVLSEGLSLGPRAFVPAPGTGGRPARAPDDRASAGEPPSGPAH